MKHLLPKVTCLVLPVLLSGCEIFSDADFSGSLVPFTEEEIGDNFQRNTGFGTITDRTITAADNFRFIGNTNCEDTPFQHELIPSVTMRPASGSMVIDDMTFTVVGGYCEGDESSFAGVQTTLIGGFWQATNNANGEVVSVYTAIAEMNNEEIDDFTVILVSDSQTLERSNISGVVGNSHAVFAKLGPPILAPTDRQIITNAASTLDLIDAGNNKDNRILNRASEQLNRANKERNWASDNTLTDRHGFKVFKNVAKAINNIERIADGTTDGALKAELDTLSAALLDSLRLIAEKRIESAIANNGDQFRIYLANLQLVAGDSYRAQDWLNPATLRYGAAWELAAFASR